MSEPVARLAADETAPLAGNALALPRSVAGLDAVQRAHLAAHALAEAAPTLSARSVTTRSTAPSSTSKRRAGGAPTASAKVETTIR